jgi:hypothetical protein
MAKNPRLIDLTGQQFGGLTVLRQAGNSPGGAALWLCQCVCGQRTKPFGRDLRLGKVKSCGCISGAATAARNFKHGMAGSRLAHIWGNMKKRCADLDNPHYGAKGISVCQEWQDFITFAKWAKDSGYSDNLTIERRDNSRGYSPDNCSWIPRGHQSFNRSIVAIAPCGRPWRHIARENGITNSAFSTRVHEGWPYEDAATRPMFKRAKPRLRDKSGRFL